METIHPDLLHAFVTVVEAGSFSGAGRALNLRQSTISQQVKRLETIAGRRLLDRDTHRMSVTPDGEVMLDHARQILDAHARLQRHLAGTPLRGRLRFGACEDFVLSALPDVLAAFARRHPEIDMAVTAGLSENLYQSFDAGALDIILVKKRPHDRRGILAWREPLSWVGKLSVPIDPGLPLPLVVYPPPSVTRALAIEALEARRRPWRVAFTSGSLSGLSAAARAGVGVMPHSARLLPPGLSILSPDPALPPLPGLEFTVIGPGGRHPAAAALTETILNWAGRA